MKDMGYNSDATALVQHQRLLLNQLHSLHQELLLLQKEQKEIFRRRRELLAEISPSSAQWMLGKQLVREQQELHARQIELLKQEKELFTRLLP